MKMIFKILEKLQSEKYYFAVCEDPSNLPNVNMAEFNKVLTALELPVKNL